MGMGMTSKFPPGRQGRPRHGLQTPHPYSQHPGINSDAPDASGGKRPILVLNFDRTPKPGNHWTRKHWAAQRKYNREWGADVAMAALRQSFTPPTAETKRIVEVHWQNHPLPDDVGARMALKHAVIDHLRRRVLRKVAGKMIWIPGIVPILWDDDINHMEEVYTYARKRPARLTISIWEEATWHIF